MKINILSQFIKNVRAYKPNDDVKHGDLYGIVTTDDIYVFSCCMTAHQLKHDPTLLLSSSFVKVGSLICSSKEQTVPLIYGNQIAIIYSESLAVYLHDGNSGAVKHNFDTFEETDFLKHFSIVKVVYSLPLICGNKTADVKNFICICKDELFSNSSYFKLKNSNLIISSDSCLPKEQALNDVGSLLYSDAGSVVSGNCFELFFNRSIGKSRTAPVLQIDSNNFPIFKSILNGEVGIYLPKSQQLCTLAQQLSKAIANQLQLVEYWILKQLHDNSLLSPIRTYLMKPIEIGSIIMPIYPTDSDDVKLLDYRKEIHQTFLLPMNRPTVKKIFSCFPEELTDVLVNPHLKTAKSGVKGGEEKLVQGLYGYHHYMQDNFDDNQWGCAYRSLQTLISWFRFQGYTEKPVPTHKEIQQILVNIKDKPSSFIGSSLWIGSTEVGFVLETYLNVNSRFISVNSGSDISDHGRSLSIHFQTVGTPIMIGGGVYAHTIIGVDWNSSTGDIKYLVLDPHYTGGKNIYQIVKQGWCGWKGQNFWNSKAFYNLCLPQRPTCL